MAVNWGLYSRGPGGAAGGAMLLLDAVGGAASEGESRGACSLDEGAGRDSRLVSPAGAGTLSLPDMAASASGVLAMMRTAARADDRV